MKLYERAYQNGYEELISYYPRFYRNVVEMVAILKAQGRLSDMVEDDIEQTYLNNFILTADEPTIATWEGILRISYSERLTLDQRKRVVIGWLCGARHIGEPEIRELIANYTDRNVDVDFGKGIIYIVIDGEIFDETNLLKTLLRRIPGHLRLDMQIHVVRRFRQTINVGFGGAVGAIFNAAQPVGEARTGTMPLQTAQGALVEAGVASYPPEGKRAAGSRENGAGGIYCHTHIKSKFMG